MNEINFIPFPRLSSQRFILRELSMEDEQEVFILRSDAQVNQFLDRQKASSIEDVRQFIPRIHANISNRQSILWAISFKEAPALGGTICLWQISPQHSTAELGYELLPQHHGKGIMQEVMPLVIRYGFEELGLNSITAAVHRDNLKSIRLLEKEGFREDAAPEDEMNKEMVFYKLTH